MLIKNNSFAVFLKSFANLLFKQLPKVNRQVRVVFCKTELMSDISTLIIMSRLACVSLDILSFQTDHIQTADVYFLVSQALLLESSDELRIVAFDGQSCGHNERISVCHKSLQFLVCLLVSRTCVCDMGDNNLVQDLKSCFDDSLSLVLHIGILDNLCQSVSFSNRVSI